MPDDPQAVSRLILEVTNTVDATADQPVFNTPRG
jgi:hypothetical protein